MAISAFALARAFAADVFVPDGNLRPDDYTVLHAADIKLPDGMKLFQPGGTGSSSRRAGNSPIRS
jgi:hypothetical protein